ncbi:muramidase family protein [Agromyces cerinus]|uniref:LysM repeat-containing protein n=1 Tax=Agromyces cerinus subsp. cerinus TaxID=232089 RepID=A0A1N6E6E5_9MICO|nr:LysM peptidoglycan-binding domain-containing protein [Agromyces cerinus]SIN78507.1 LysM repeat-containing protein [Agromyces cerinus subsp. cerinus]
MTHEAETVNGPIDLPRRRPRDVDDRRRGIRRLITLPLAVVSTIAVTLGIAQPAEAAPQSAKRMPKAKASNDGPARHAAASATVSAASVPSEVTVGDGDTVSSIAERYGVATADILALNGLGWSSLIFPGQRLALPGSGTAAPAPEPVAAELPRHTVVAGDTMSGIAAAHGVSLDEMLSANGLGRQSLIFPGQSIVLPPGGTDAPAPAPATPAPAAPAPVSPAPSSADTYTVVDGDTLWDIAARHDLDVAELIAINGLDTAAVIRAGQVLRVARPVAVVSVASVSVALTDEMRGNARIIVDVGRSLGVPDQGIVIALAAAAQESGLKNPEYGDLDSLGLFQQRPSQGWGTVDEVLDPVRAATAFYGGAANPNAGRTRGLLDIPGWESLTVTQAAQAVQESAHPDHYAKWEASARAWLSELG